MPISWGELTFFFLKILNHYSLYDSIYFVDNVYMYHENFFPKTLE